MFIHIIYIYNNIMGYSWNMNGISVGLRDILILLHVDACLVHWCAHFCSNFVFFSQAATSLEPQVIPGLVICYTLLLKMAHRKR